MIKYECEIYTIKNAKAEDKPNEDFAVFNEELGIGMVLDGVSRDRENGIYPDPSPAQIATHVFANAALTIAKEGLKSGIDKVQSMILSGNNELRKYNHLLNHRFPAGTVGIVFLLENDMFHYGYIGDCYEAIIRNGMMRGFTECQTEMVAKHKKDFTSDEIRFDICNHVSHPCGYGVWDGNDDAMNFVKYGSIRILDGDIWLVYTDGIRETIDKMDVPYLAEKNFVNLMETNANYALDDQTCLRIVIKE